jgi:hypothetical protein
LGKGKWKKKKKYHANYFSKKKEYKHPRVLVLCGPCKSTKTPAR